MTAKPSPKPQRSIRVSPFHIYILRCADGSLYVGVTRELDSRIEVHNSGRGSAI